MDIKEICSPLLVKLSDEVIKQIQESDKKDTDTEKEKEENT